MATFRRRGERPVYLCYFDESGDSGTSNIFTSWFVLNCLSIQEEDWLDVLDAVVQLRQNLRDSYGIPPRAELKGAWFRNKEGPFVGLKLSRPERMDIYREVMNYQSGLPLRTFSVAIHKDRARARGWEPRYAAWTFALQRVHRMAREDGEWCSLFPDEGHGFFIRQRVRAMRRFHHVPRHYGPGSIPFRIERILEDPSDRRSQDSYFIQIADMNAYAAHRSKYVHPKRKVADDLWDCLETVAGDARHLPVNKERGGPPGIVVYP